MTVPIELLDKYGKPVNESAKWASWYCPKCHSHYDQLLYNKATGWLGCRATTGCIRVKIKKDSRRLTVFQRRTPRLKAAELIPHMKVPTSSTIPWAYCKARGLTPDEIETYVAHWPEHLPLYAVFPVVEDGDFLSWHARYANGDHILLKKHGEEQAARLRWLSPKLLDGCLPTKKVVWGLDRLQQGEPVYLCEGIFDAFYFDNGVAFMGFPPTETQLVKVLDRLPSRCILAFDAGVDTTDVQAQIKRLNREMPLSTIPLPTGVKDWGELVAKGKRHGHS